MERDATRAAGQALVQVRAVSLNYCDMLPVTWRYSFSTPSPDLIPVSNGVGEVIGIGTGVTRWQIRGRVAGIFS